MKDVIAVQGYRTGTVHTRVAKRTSFVFDLTKVNLGSADLLCGVLQLTVRAGTAALVSLVDPSGQTAYGTVSVDSRSQGTTRIPLTAAAVADLEQAGGGLFSVDAIFHDAHGRTGASSVVDVSRLVLTTVQRSHVVAIQTAA
jgi:hypothetical protein